MRFHQMNQKISGSIRAALPAILLHCTFNGAVCWSAVLGQNPPAEPLTTQRIAQLPPSERSAWLSYLENSAKQRQADKDAFAAELKSTGTAPTEPPHGSAARSMPLDRSAAWYSSPEAAHTADVIVSFQTPAGGWSKNMDMSKEVRHAGEKYGPNNLSYFLAQGDFDAPADPDWNYIGTIDNDATTTQLKFMARVIAASKLGTDRYRKSFLRGIDYLLAAQYPNGGWPQVWPLEGRYHDAITFNDSAMTQVLEVLDDVAQGEGDYAFTPEPLRRRAKASFTRGIQCILASQINSNGVLTAWPQQVDPLTLQPISARNFEPPAVSSGESMGIVLLLMDRIRDPDAAQSRAIRSAVTWLQQTAIYGKSWQTTAQGRTLVDTPGAGPLWARFSQVGTNKPIFGDRDKSIHDDVQAISYERRNGYAWYSTVPQQALNRFATWNQQHPEPK